MAMKAPEKLLPRKKFEEVKRCVEAVFPEAIFIEVSKVPGKGALLSFVLPIGRFSVDDDFLKKIIILMRLIRKRVKMEIEFIGMLPNPKGSYAVSFIIK